MEARRVLIKVKQGSLVPLLSHPSQMGVEMYADFTRYDHPCLAIPCPICDARVGDW